ncbi:MAG: type I-B CRISPR-associated protein Cas8b1/Cst1 [Gammaproteobacteria bacterium]|nr:type I-B CRISPR-associated protein Cas8b1/Cst1 [Gammaproteobacteria bacterium]
MAQQEYQGHCHCRKVEFTVNTDLAVLYKCNCSFCSRRNARMILLDRKDFNLLSGKEDLTCYQFDSMQAKHYFCKHCGIYIYHQTRRSKDLLGVNSHCLEGVDIFDIEIKLVDGKSY